jgi:putative DNA primase/helicase
VGPSSCGKTTLARAASSVFGGRRFLERWRATDNGLEGVAACHNDALLALDELAQADARTVGSSAYMLANGEGKRRASRTGDARPRKRWQLLFLSNGETTLAQHIAAAGGTVRAGQEVRLVDLPADAGKGLGVFEDLHGAEDAAEFARNLSDASQAYYGTASREFAAKCVENVSTLEETVAGERNAVMSAMLAGLGEEQPEGQVVRVAARFALIGAAGEVATALGVTGWEVGEARGAVMTCFRDWLEARGTAHNSEPQAIVQSVQGFLSRHGESRFTDASTRAEDEADGRRSRATHNRAGWRVTFGNTTEFLIEPDVFKREVCQGFDPTHVCRVLAAHDCLKHGVEAGKTRYALHRSTPDGKRRVYIVTDAIWAL